MADMLSYAYMYNALGFNVLPVAQDKRPPIVGSFVKEGETIPIRYKWKEYQSKRQSIPVINSMPWNQTTGIAGICGANENFAIDFDGSDEWPVRKFLKKAGLSQSYPWIVRSPGGGYHVWVRTQDEMPTRIVRPGKQCKQVELRGKNHYCILPFSINSSGQYLFGNRMPKERPQMLDGDIIMAAWEHVVVPKEEVAMPTQPASTTGSAMAIYRSQVNQLMMAREGTRNDTLNRVSYTVAGLVQAGRLDSSCIDDLNYLAKSIGLGEGESQATINSGQRSGAAKPLWINQ